ncbi:MULTISPECIES: asparaginase [Prauserella salsuginis group]|uniref:Asparaginase n=1 Tax=Prauserella salsuginis TaxID=387889 RepID=A0ABW6G0A3_9PSEU|nr:MULTISPECIES: asparaginase [Prauserella salsuginis group]MCR3721241.1 asparaginase [Prauserella flava]MCR3734678.1 asparaginase [Prauserella salsuginis]
MTALVEVVRSGFVESVHHGSVVVTAPDGSVRASLGDVDEPMYPRSSNKPLQALGMLRAGLDVADDDLALVCASHNGEPEHVERTLTLLAKAGLDEDTLHCPPDTPRDRPAAERRRAAMNCSGKHAGMLSTCVSAEWPTATYTDPEHPLQRAIAETVSEATGEPIAWTGVDGCGAPLLAYSLTGLARAFGRLVTADSDDLRRVADAMRAHPWLVAGTGREDTVLMDAVPGLLMKGGAEGVHAFALADGTAVALKVADGNARAREPILVEALRLLGATPAGEAVDRMAVGAGIVTGADRDVGSLRVTTALADALR